MWSPPPNNNEASNTSTAKKPKAYTDQPVYVRSYTLLKELTVCYSRIPRDLRYTLGSRMLEAMTDEVMNVVHAFKTAKGKTPFIKEAMLRLEEVKVCLRLLKDVDAISTKFYLHTLPLTADVTTQLASWHNFTKRRETISASFSKP